MLKKRAQIIQQIRHFFEMQNVIEVQTPILLNTPTTDVYIDSLVTHANKQIKYLHSSPELAMKKLIAQGSGNIYQICPVFRNHEMGERNFNEFTLLEYYRLGFDVHQLMDNVADLLKTLGMRDKVQQLTYAQAFFEFADIDILNSNFKTLKKIAKSHQLSNDFVHIEDLQMLLFVHFVEPKLEALPLCFIYDYPAQQSALARVDGQIAHRFELYLSGVEVANGYDELQYGAQYSQRFGDENHKRQALLKPVVAMDDDFLQQLKTPLPQCAGVAIGIERLLSKLWSKSTKI